MEQQDKRAAEDLLPLTVHPNFPYLVLDSLYCIPFPLYSSSKRTKTLHRLYPKSTMVKLQRCNEGRGFSSWSLLLTELLWLIMARLDFIDIHCVAAVCRNWRSALKNYSNPASLLKPKDPFPWLMITTNIESSVRKFFRPLTNKTFKIDMPEFRGTKCIFSKKGWLLLNRGTYDVDILLFNPFTMARIELPKLKKGFVLYRATFSTHLDYPKCVILIGSVDRKLVIISTWKLGDNMWSDRTYRKNPNQAVNRLHYLSNIWLHDDQICIFNPNGTIGLLNNSTGKWLVKFSNEKIDLSYDMVECGNDLFAIPLGNFLEFIAYKFDPSKMEWVIVPTENLFWFVGSDCRIGFMVREHWTKVLSMADGLANHGYKITIDGRSVVVDRVRGVFENTFSVWINVG